MDSVCVLLSTYNGETYIEEQLDSLLRQKDVDLRIVIRDDASKDNTIKIIEDYIKNNTSGAGITLLESDGNLGPAKAFLELLKKAPSADYYAFCDQDDVWLEDKIEKTRRHMERLEEDGGKDRPALVFSDLAVVDEDLCVIAKSMNEYQKLDPERTGFGDLLIQSVVSGCTMMMNRACVEKAMQGFNPDNIIMHDWWCSLVAARFGRISYLDEAPILYRQHGGNSIGAKAIADPRYIMRRIACGKEIKRTLELTRRQALEFAETYGLGPEDIASRYSAVGSEGKRSRLRFYRSHNIRKHGFVRNCGLILFG